MAAIQTVGVVGLGTMGAGIVEVFAKQGLAVVGVEIDDAALARGQAIIERSTGRALERGRLTEDDRAALLGRITWTTAFEDLAAVDLVIEAVPERMDIKRDLFQRLDGICKPETILATNTSSLSVTAIAATTKRPQQVVGMHFFNPAPAMKLVEVIRTVLTDDAVVEAVRDLASGAGKTPIVVGDRAGFVANTLLVGYLGDAVRLFAETSVTREDIDDAMRLATGVPMGPLALCDLIGNDVILEVLEVLFADSRDPVHAPPSLLRTMVAAGLNGRKSGRGFYTYEKPGSGKVVPDTDTPAEDTDATVAPTRIGIAGSGPLTGVLVDAFATGGCDVVLFGKSTTRAEQARGDALAGLAPDAAARVRQVDELDAFADREFVIECINADPRARAGLIASLDPVLAAGTVLAASAPRTRAVDLAEAVEGRAADVLGFHILEPTPAGRLVEIATTPATSDAAVASARALARSLGATPVRVEDAAGYVVARLLFVYLNDAVRLAATGYASPQDIDTAMRLGCGYPMGPFEVLDALGAARVVEVLDLVHAETQQSRHAPVRALRDHAALGLPFRGASA